MHQPKKFCTEYQRKLELDKDIKENEITQPWNDYRDRIKFVVVQNETCPGYLRLSMCPGESVLTLDTEDLEYLYNKYNK
jgi:hypothetical protein